MLNLNVEDWEQVPANTYINSGFPRIYVAKLADRQEHRMPKFCEESSNVCAFYFTRLHPDDGRTYS